MASSSQATSAVPVEESQAVAGASATDDHEHAGQSSKAVEMNDLSMSGAEAGPSTAQASSSESTEHKKSTEQTLHPQPPDLNRSETAELALGPDGQPGPSTDPSAPTLQINLMLTTGARHAYTISQKYLTSRKVTAVDASGNFDPREMSGYKLKELIWTDWRSEWEARPRDPSSIRLIIMGRMIDDKVALKDLPFSLPNVNVVHMTVKPADLLEDDAEGGAKSGGKGSIRAHNAGEEGGSGCRCVIM